MKNKHYKIKLGIIAFVCVVLVWACTKKAEFVNPPTKLNIQVFREDGKPLKHARVAIFVDYAKYDSAKWKYETDNGDFYDETDADGFVYFNGVDSDVRYYVLCKYDSVVAKGDTITWSNTSEDYQFLNPLKANTVTTAQVFVTAADGFVQFWSNNDYVTKQPINIRLSSGQTTIVDTIGKSTKNKVKLRAGTYTYQGKSAYGCAWVGTITVEVGKKVQEELTSCIMVPVTILATATTAPGLSLPITVVLNNTDTLKQRITAFGFSANGTNDYCSYSNTISVSRPAGTYSYQFIGSNSTVKLGTTKFEKPTTGVACDTLVLRQ
jgi:hypothetical protein